MFIQTIPEAEAEGKLREVYDGDQKTFGYVPNHAKVFSLRPDVLEAWRAFQGSIRKNLRLRRYELVTLAAAQGLELPLLSARSRRDPDQERRQRGSVARHPDGLPRRRAGTRGSRR